MLRVSRCRSALPPASFITAFVTTFATVIAITKDLPDVEGDRANNISTFATRLGVDNVSKLGARQHTRAASGSRQPAAGSVCGPRVGTRSYAPPVSHAAHAQAWACCWPTT